ncbi:MAG TPA: ATP-binding protein [Gemmatimonadaceae bacterium]|nr:ATP-binding protein [Gemmatimonadaceae bacterium]
MEAVESAALIEGFLAVHAEALQSVRGLYLDTTRRVTPEQFHLLVGSLGGYASAYRRIWVTDTAGHVIAEHLLGAEAGALPEGVDVDTLSELGTGVLARRARLTRRPQISAPGRLFTGERGFVLLQPIFVAGRFRGFVGGTIASDAILANVAQGRPHLRGRLIVLAGADTVTVRPGDSSPSRLPVRRDWSMLSTPGGAMWRVVVERPTGDERAHFLLWGVGLATLGALIVMLLHERRQGQRLAERSSELERLSAELLRANRAKSEFLANVSHELRTPLNAIVGFVELLRDGVYGDLAPRQIAPVDRIASSANHLRQLVDQILDLAKMAAGRLEVHVEPVDLRPFVLNVASEVESLVSDRGLNLSVAVSSSLPRISTDPMHLRQILLNLLGNAIKFTSSGGIAVRARLASSREEAPTSPGTPGGVGGPAVATLGVAGTGVGAPASRKWIVLQVADSGMGIAPADRQRIFEEFEQVNAGPRSDSMQRGTGLGLPISRRLARLLGGDLTVDSELGKGSTFSVWLPVDEEVTASARGITDEARHAEPSVRAG